MCVVRECGALFSASGIKVYSNVQPVEVYVLWRPPRFALFHKTKPWFSFFLTYCNLTSTLLSVCLRVCVCLSVSIVKLSVKLLLDLYNKIKLWKPPC